MPFVSYRLVDEHKEIVLVEPSLVLNINESEHFPDVIVPRWKMLL